MGVLITSQQTSSLISWLLEISVVEWVDFVLILPIIRSLMKSQQSKAPEKLVRISTARTLL
jgi:hypothetical protein